MFSNLLDLAYTRSWVQAIGFYIVFFIAGLVISAILAGATTGLAGVFVGPLSFDEGFAMGKKVGIVAAILWAWGLSGAILKAKRLHNNILYLTIAFLSGPLAVLSGGLGAMIPVAYLTTRGIPQTAGEANPTD